MGANPATGWGQVAGRRVPDTPMAGQSSCGGEKGATNHDEDRAGNPQSLGGAEEVPTDREKEVHESVSKRP